MQSMLELPSNGAPVSQSGVGEPEQLVQASSSSTSMESPQVTTSSSSPASSTASPAERLPVEILEYILEPIIRLGVPETDAETLLRFRRASALSLVCRKWHRPAVAAFWHKFELIDDGGTGVRGGAVQPRAPARHPLRPFDRAFLQGPALERCAPLVRHLVCSAPGAHDPRVGDAIVALRHLCNEVRTVHLFGGEAFKHFLLKPVHAPPLVHLSHISGSVIDIGRPGVVEVLACLDAMAVALPSLASLVVDFGDAASWAPQPRFRSSLPLLRLKKLHITAGPDLTLPDDVTRLFASLDLAHLEDLDCGSGSDFDAFSDVLPHCKRLRRLDLGGAATSLVARSSGERGRFLPALSSLSALEAVVLRRTSTDAEVLRYALNASRAAQGLAALPVGVKDVALFLDFPSHPATLVALDRFVAERTGGALEAFEWTDVGLDGRRSTLRWELCDGKLVRVSDF